jgi:hypothetical protein
MESGGRNTKGWSRNEYRKAISGDGRRRTNSCGRADGMEGIAKPSSIGDCTIVDALKSQNV